MVSKINLTTLASWLFPTLSITIVIALSAGLIYPWAKDSFTKRKEVTEKQNQLDKVLKPKLELLQTLNKETLRTQLGKLELILPSRIQTPYVFASIENLAAENEVTLEGLSFVRLEKGKTKTKTKEAPPEVIQLNFIASGEADSLANFVNALEQAAPLFGITTYTQTKNEDEPDKGSLAVSSFYKILPQKVGGVKEPLKAWSKKAMEALSKVGEFRVGAVSTSEESVSQTIPLGKTNPF